MVWKITVITRKKDSEKALKLLQEAAEAVTPLIQRKKWLISELIEFYPANQGLHGMNVNRGKKIMIRLRESYDENMFLAMESILHTLVHELTHMVHDKHSVEFYELLDQLMMEVQRDLTTGMKGTGKTVGGKFLTSKLEGCSSDIRNEMASAALKRRHNSLLSAGSGIRLGGGAHTFNDSSHSREDLRKRMSEAAERRIRDEKFCKCQEFIDGINIDIPTPLDPPHSLTVMRESNISSTSSSSFASDAGSKTSFKCSSTSSSSGRNRLQALQIASQTDLINLWECSVCQNLNLNEETYCYTCTVRRIDSICDEADDFESMNNPCRETIDLTANEKCDVRASVTDILCTQCTNLNSGGLTSCIACDLRVGQHNKRRRL